MNFTTLISGAGPTGLAAAILLARDGVNTAVIAPPPKADLRTTALMQPAIQLLKFMGVWSDELKSVSAPLKYLSLIDDTGNLVTAPTVEFSAHELNLEEFGWNVPLANLIPILQKRAADLGVKFIVDESMTAAASPDFIQVETKSGASFTAKILLAADGAFSPIRKSLGITVENWSFDQAALVTSFDHSAPHDFMSTEYHKSAGPFTTVPLPGNRSSLVWLDRPTKIEAVAALSDAALAIEIQLQTKGKLGRISGLGPRKTFAMNGQRATSFVASRCIVLGEAAHVLPPIGAQGLNLSLRDAAAAADLIIGSDDPGVHQHLREYNNTRRADVLPRQFMVNFLNHSLLTSFPALAITRAVGLNAIANFAPLRNMAMRQGLAPDNLPYAMRG